MSELKTCPFCDGDNLLDYEEEEEQGYTAAWYECFGCGAHGPLGGDKEEAVMLWNCRAGEEQDVSHTEAGSL